MFSPWVSPQSHCKDDTPKVLQMDWIHGVTKVLRKLSAVVLFTLFIAAATSHGIGISQYTAVHSVGDKKFYPIEHSKELSPPLKIFLDSFLQGCLLILVLLREK